MAETVAELLDKLPAGSMTAEQVAAEFSKRTWAKPRPASDAEFWGVADVDEPGDDEWATVNADSRLTPEQYAILSSGYRQALAKRL